MADEETKLNPPSTATAEEDEDAPKADEEDTGAQIAPIVKLEEVAVSTGEENENILFEIKSKLYRFDKDASQWKERGVGQAKLLEHKTTKKIRLLMRQQKTLKICANHQINPAVNLQEHAGNDKAWVWHAQDFSDGEVKDELFTMRFGSVESARKFNDAYEDAQEKMKTILGAETAQENSPAGADEAAESLENLKVTEGKKEEVSKNEEESA